MTPRDQQALDLYQQHIRTDGPAVADALLSDFFAPSDYIATLDAVRNAVSESEKSEMTFEEEDEAALQFALVGFRTMNPDMRSAFLVGAMDEFCRLAKDGEVDARLASQILVRAQLIASAPKREAA